MFKTWGQITCLLLLIATTPSLGAQETTTDYFALYFNGSRCGYTVESRQVKGQQVISTESMHLEIKRMGIPLKMAVTETAVETLQGRPLGFHLDQDMALMHMHIDGTIDPNGNMEMVSTNAGQSGKSYLPYPKGAVMTEGLRLLTLKHGLKPGTTYTARVFTASAMKAIEMKFTVGQAREVDLLGRVVKLVEVTSEYEMPGAGQMASTSFVDPDCRAQKVIMPVAGIQIEMVACSETFAKSQVEAAELVGSMMLASPTVITNPRDAQAITYILKPKQSGVTLHIPTTDNQQVEPLADGRVRVVVHPVAGDPKASYPYGGDDPNLKEALASTAFLQCDQPEIVALAKKAVQGKKTALEAARAIETFVADYIQNKNMSVGYASALEVAQSKQGDCTEHAVLTAALCRAVGIPARVVVGVAYVNEFMGAMHCFGGHAWDQAWIGNHWVGLDATFKGTGRGGYDAGHLALAVGNGDPGDFFSLVGSLGLFTIEKIDVERWAKDWSFKVKGSRLKVEGSLTIRKTTRGKSKSP